MSPDLEHLVRLQQLDSDAEARRLTLAEHPQILLALDARVATREATLAQAKSVLAENQTARRNLEKDLAVVQTRLARYKEQLNEVKTNKEYTAMQHEITTAQDVVRGFEDQILELLVQQDDVTSSIKTAEDALAEERKTTSAARKKTETDAARLEKEIAELQTAREAERQKLPPEALKLFDSVARSRKGSAVAEVRDGHCTACHVRLRPQFFNEVRRGDKLVRCESCQRILVFIPPKPVPAPTPPAADSTPA